MFDKRKRYFKHLQVLLSFSVGVVVCGLGNQIMIANAKEQELLSPIPKDDFVIWTETKEVLIENTDTLIGKYADKYKVDRYLLHCIIKFESGYRDEAKNPTSSASGLGQFISSTWISWRNKMGENPDLDLRFNKEEAIKTLAWALSKGYKNHWEVVSKGYCY